MAESPKARILLMEDDPGLARLLQKRLERQGYRVDLAYDGAEGLAMVDAGSYDILILDQVMPVYSGLDVIRVLAERGPLPPVIMVTGTGSEPIAVEALKLGARDYIVKDVEGGYLDLLPAVIEQVLQQQRLIEEKQQALEALQARARQQAVLAELGLQALSGKNLAALVSEAVHLVAETLQVEYCKVLELLPSGEALLLRAGVGWQDGLVGQATVSAGLDSQAGFTLLSSEPVIVPDLAAETRFSGPPLLHDHGVVSGISVIIQGQERPYGVMGAHTTRRRQFTQDDANFLQAVANILAEAIQRKRTEQALRESEEKLRLIFENAFDGISIHEELPATRSRRLIDCNERYAELAGRSKQELLEIQNTSLVQRDLGPIRSTEENWRLRREKISYRGLFSWLRPDNKENVIEYTAVPIQVGDRALTIGIDRDITERMQAAQTMQRQTWQLATLNQIGRVLSQLAPINAILHQIYLAIGQIFDNDNLYIALYDETAGWLSFPVYTIDGQLRDTGIGRPFGNGITEYVIRTKTPLCIPSDLQETLTELGIDLIGRLSRSLLAVPILLGEKVLGVITLQDYQNENAYTSGDVDLLANIASQAAIAIENARLHENVQRELAERRRAEQALQELNADLEERVRERTQELRDAQEQLVRREKLAVLGQLAGGVGHDLRNPLGVISNSTYLLRMVHPDPDETTQQCLDIIEGAVARATTIVSDLLDFARTREPDRELVDVQALVAEALDRQPPPDNVTVTTAIPPDLPPAFVDPHQIGRVLANLITNAYQAMPDGGRLSVNSEQTGDGILDTGYWVLITVSDTGVGIPPEHMEKLFEPLFTTKARGIGLGLATSRQLVEANEGRIEAFSEGVPGKGSRFTLWLPTVGEP